MTGHLTTYPLLGRKNHPVSRVAKRAFFSFIFLNLSFIKDGSGSIGAGLLQMAKPCQRGTSTSGGWTSAFESCSLGVFFHVIWLSEADDYGLWHRDGASKQRQEGLVDKPFRTPKSWFQRLFPLSAVSDQPT